VARLLEAFEIHADQTTEKLLRSVPSAAGFSIIEFRKKDSIANGEDDDADESDWEERISELMGEEWPSQPENLDSPTIDLDIQTQKPLDQIYLVLIPTKNAFEIPAYMKLGWME
jgi:hypothetical protein